MCVFSCVCVCKSKQRDNNTCTFMNSYDMYTSISANPQNKTKFPSASEQSTHEALTQSISCQVTALRGGEVILSITWGSMTCQKCMLLFSGWFAAAQVVEGVQTEHDFSSDKCRGTSPIFHKPMS